MTRAGLASPMLERALALGVVRYGLAAAMELIFIGEQPSRPNRPARMKFAVADSQLCAKAITEAIGKAGRGV